MLKVAINGFGRIGRMVLRSYFEHREKYAFEIVAINDLSPAEMNAHLLTYDSVHGKFFGTVLVENEDLVVTLPSGKTSRIHMLQASSPLDLPWGKMAVDLVFECSGRFNDGGKAKAHIDAGAKRVIISAPASNVDATVVFGVNHENLSTEARIISNASCTTNCLAPVAKILHEMFDIESGYMTTVHAYTADQRLVDGAQSDPYRARSAGLSLIPTTTGAAKAVGLVLPELHGKLDGTAIRVPTPNVSLIDFTFTCVKEISVQKINTAMIDAAKGTMQGILATNALPLVSVDFTHNTHSSIFDLAQTQVIGKHFGRVLSWYDNEWGFSCRMLDLAEYLEKNL